MFGSLESRGKEKVLMICLIDIPIPADPNQIEKIQEKYEAAIKVLEKCKTPSQKLHIRCKNAKRKLEISSQMSKVRTVRIWLKEHPHLQKILHLKNNIKESWIIYLVKIFVQKQNLKMLTLKFQSQSKNCKLATETFGEK